MNQGVLVGVGNVTPQNKTLPIYPSQSYVPYSTSGTWTAPVSGVVTFYAVGAGGSGGARYNTAYDTRNAASGGGAGGLAIKNIAVVAGAVYTITIGAGGTPSSTTAQTTANGTAGGNTSVSGPGIYLQASGGGGGTQTLSAVALTGGAGGVATGGTFNFTGGSGGSIASTTRPAATGGGAVAWRGVTYSAGGITGTVGMVATGGAGVGGSSGSISGSTNNAGTGGGGSMGASASIISGTSVGGAGIYGTYGSYVESTTPYLHPYSTAIVAGMPGAITPLAPGGAGTNTGGTVAGDSTTGGGGGGAGVNGGYLWGGNSIWFGGGGGTSCDSGAGINTTALQGFGGIGGGGGGLATGTTTRSGVTHGGGGNGLVLVYFQC